MAGCLTVEAEDDLHLDDDAAELDHSPTEPTQRMVDGGRDSTPPAKKR